MFGSYGYLSYLCGVLLEWYTITQEKINNKT